MSFHVCAAVSYMDLYRCGSVSVHGPLPVSLFIILVSSVYYTGDCPVSNYQDILPAVLMLIIDTFP